MKVKISVIVPCFNTVNSIVRTIESILSNTYKKFEIICVDDGSTDNTNKIISQLAKKDNRIKLIKEKHSGPGCARNLGISVSKGDYLSFIDSDDEINRFFFDKLLNYAYEYNVDIVFVDFKVISTTNSTKYQNEINNHITISKKYPKFFYRSYCSALYKRSFLLENHISFPRYFCSEDSIFALRASIKSSKTCYAPGASYFYNYSINSKSPTKKAYLGLHNLIPVFKVTRLISFIKKLYPSHEFEDYCNLEITRILSNRFNHFISINKSFSFLYVNALRIKNELRSYENSILLYNSILEKSPVLGRFLLARKSTALSLRNSFDWVICAYESAITNCPDSFYFWGNSTFLKEFLCKRPQIFNKCLGVIDNSNNAVNSCNSSLYKICLPQDLLKLRHITIIVSVTHDQLEIMHSIKRFFCNSLLSYKIILPLESV